MTGNARFKTCRGPCGQRLPATTKFFGRTTSRGKRLNAFGEPYLRGICKRCRVPTIYEHTDYKAHLQRARTAAYRRLGEMNPEGLKMLYREELEIAGIDPDTVRSPLLTREADG